MKVTLYQNVKQTSGGTDVEFADLIKAIRNPSELTKRKVEFIRTRPYTEICEVKQSLKGFTVHGTFNKRNNAGLKETNGLMHLDYDGGEEGALEKIKNCFIWKYVYAVFRSPSSKNNLKVFYRVDFDEAKRKEVFKFITDNVEISTGLSFDLCVHDLSRFCFVSHDSEAYLNEDAEVLKVENKHLPPKRHVFKFQNELHYALGLDLMSIEDFKLEERFGRYEAGNRDYFVFNAAGFLFHIDRSWDEVAAYFSNLCTDGFDWEGRVGRQYRYKMK